MNLKKILTSALEGGFLLVLGLPLLAFASAAICVAHAEIVIDQSAPLSKSNTSLGAEHTRRRGGVVRLDVRQSAVTECLP
jgi:hypothetical protein